MTATVTEPTARPLATGSPENAPANVVAFIGLGIGVLPILIAVLTIPFAAVFDNAIFVILVSPLLSLGAILFSAIGIGVSHWTQDRFGGTGGYWFALAGLLLGFVGIYLFLASFSV